MSLQIKLEHISKSFDGKPILDDVSFVLSAPDTYLFSAPSGSGKTTLFRILMGLEKPDAGRFFFLDSASALSEKTDRASKERKVSDPPRPGQEVRIAAVFQENRLLEDADAVTNILFAAGCSKEKAENALLALLPDADLHKPVRSFSGGEKRRVALLRALCSDAELLIMDEPFTGLDKETKAKVIAYIKAEKKDRLLLLSSHEPEDAKALSAKIITF